MKNASVTGRGLGSTALCRRLLTSLFAVFLLVACDLSGSRLAFNNVDITGGKSFSGDFALLDPAGKTRTLQDFRGKAVVMFFGYTQCPDVCPTTLVEMREVMERMGPDASRVQVLFVTVDPARDTPELLAAYVPAFHPDFIGLRPADDAALQALAKGLHVFYSKAPGSSPDLYTMDHTAGSYVFDPQGRLRLFLRHGQGAEPVAQDLRTLLKQG